MNFNLLHLSMGLLILAGIGLGCSKSEPFSRVAVNGTVTLDGEPVNGVTIRFEPASDEEAPHVVCPVVNGEFRLTKRNGPAACPYKVIIQPEELDPEVVFDKSNPSLRKETLTRHQQLANAIRRKGDLTVELNAEEANEVRLELVSK